MPFVSRNLFWTSNGWRGNPVQLRKKSLNTDRNLDQRMHLFILLKETSNPQLVACQILAFLYPIQTKAPLLVEYL
jgi:hypothetical protein